MGYYVAKGLQLMGMLNLLVGLYIGFAEERGMEGELVLLLIGGAVFSLGRLLEGWSQR